MSIASEITRINTNIANSYTAVDSKNGTLPQVQNSANLASAIDSIEVIEQATAEGESLSLANTKAMPYSDYVVEGKSEQDGEPSPSNPSEIHSVADDVNLFDVTNKTATLGGASYTAKNGEIIINGQSTQNASITVGKVYLKANTNYYFSCNNNNSLNDSYFVFNDHGTNIFLNQDRTFTVSQDGEYEPGFILISGTYSNLIIRPKFQKGTEATPYSPYNQGTVTIKQRGTTENNNYTIQTAPLRSLPNGVKDTIEVEQHRKIEYLIFDGSDDEGWGSYTVLSNNIIQVGKPLSKTAKSRVGLSNRFSVVADYSSTEHIVIAGGLTAVYIHIDQTRLNTQDLAGFKEWLSNNPVTLQYELETEIIEPLTQNQATTMLDITHTGSYEGTTNIYTDEDVKPTIKVGYYKKG